VAGKAPGRAGGGFTLVELVLVLGMVLLLAGIVVLNLGAWRTSRALEEGTLRFETALRLARSDAANRGRRLQVALAPDTEPQVLWEAKPLEEPGVFSQFTACTWREVLTAEGIRVESCEIVGPSKQRPADWGASTATDKDPGPTAITFEPDGSSDSAVIMLSATGGNDTRLGVIELDGLTGIITRTMSSSATASTSP
jgi:type II secretory pathway pseudopilin PulG